MSEKVRFHGQMMIGEEFFALVINHFWIKEVEGKLFHPSTGGNFSIRLTKKSSPIKVNLQKGLVAYSGTFRVLAYSGLTGHRPVFDGRLNISGRTSRQSQNGEYAFKTNLEGIEWLSETGLNLGPFKIPLKRINNFLSSILKNRLAERVDSIINRLLSADSMPKDLEEEFFSRINLENPLQGLILNRVHIHMGNFEPNFLPIVAKAGLSPLGHSEKDLKVFQKDVKNIEDSVSKIYLNLDSLQVFAPPIELNTWFLDARLVFEQFIREERGVRMVISAEKGIKGEVELLLPVSKGGQFDPGMLTIERVKLKSAGKQLVFKLFRKTIQNRIRRDLKEKLDLVMDGMTDRPLFYSPPLSGFCIAVNSGGKIDIGISGDDLLIKVELIVSLVRDNQLPLALSEAITE